MPDSVMPPALAPRATVVPPFRKPAMPIVPALREMFAAPTVPATFRLPVLAIVRLPLPSVILPSDPMVLLAPPSVMPPAMVPALARVAAMTVPVDSDTPPAAAPRAATVPALTVPAMSSVPALSEMFGPDTRPATDRLPVSVRVKPPPLTAKLPTVAMVLVPVSVAPPAMVPMLTRVPAVILPDSVMPPALAPRAMAVPAFRKPPMPSVPAFTEMFRATMVPAADRLPVLTKAKSPVVTVKPWIAPMAFLVPARLTVPVTPLVLCNVLAVIVPVDTCVTPPVADRSTVAPDRMWPVPNVMPPVRAASVSPVLAPMLPDTVMVVALVSEIGPAAAVSGPETVRLPVRPPLSSENPLAPLTAKLPMAAILAPLRTTEAALPLRVEAVRILLGDCVIAPEASRSSATVLEPKLLEILMLLAVGACSTPPTVTAPIRTLVEPMPV